MKNKILIVIIFLLPLAIWAQTTEQELVIESVGVKIHGSLITPEINNGKLLIIIAGSGPTDRDGNQKNMVNNSLKMLADSVSACGSSTFRFDKRGIGASELKNFKEDDLTFDLYVNDVIAIINHFKKTNTYAKIYVAGHSEGSLIGMMAGLNNADGLISIAGAGFPAGEIIGKQLAKQKESLKEMAQPIIDSLTQGFNPKNVDPILAKIFRPSVFNYLKSWFAIDPKIEIGKWEKPVFIAQGLYDIQVEKEDAERLMQGNPKAKGVLYKRMNHVLKNLPENDYLLNMGSYRNPDLPINHDLIDDICTFINSN